MRKWMVLMAVVLILMTSPVQGASILSVEEAMNQPNGADITVEGYIVGVPTAIDYVQQSHFTSNYALALADDPNETQVNEMIFVKLEADYRREFGLADNPENMGQCMQVDGTRDPYFSHEGMESIRSISAVNDEGNEGGDDETSPAGYYDSADGLSGDVLKQELHNIIDDHTELSYSSVWEALRETDEDPNNSNNVLLLYSGKSLSKFDNGGNGDDWNREHVWAKSHGDFGTSRGPGTDIHHLRPTDVTVNSARGNLDFDNGGSTFPEAPGTYYDLDSWEPRDEVKGDVARMIFYMDVRYEGDVGELDLEVADYAGTSGPYLGKLTTLKQWHENDPVDAFERHRNDVIYSDYQGNRNPFVDHPEFVEQIW
ncbi:endonuclease [Halobacillus sp. Marseille-Q1614]|uniref:endonuclease n=1 Tax=Halobacillus sp. Marseille-Q1614 TaxID=2709134 RepID=UPI00156FC5AF|nr:endonuclease [Halobacillus sp. Marseille-Q1614]